MKIKINGEEQVLEETLNVSDFLTGYLNGKDSKGIAVARNGTIVPRSQWRFTMIEENDEIEIVHAVQGG